MQITFHGVRGSTPCDRVDIARYGGNTSCVSLVAEGEDPILFDLGTGLRNSPWDDGGDTGAGIRCTCLLSHLHWDHVQGLPFFAPLRNERSELVIYAPEQEDRRSPAEVLAATIGPPLFPIGLYQFPGRVRVRVAPESWETGGFSIRSAPVPHIGPMLGYRVTHRGRSVAYISDHQQPSNSLRIADSVRELCDGVDLLIHDSQYTSGEFTRKATWGHCTVEYAVWLASQVGARRLALYHHDPDRDDDMLDRLAHEAKTCGGGFGVDVFAAAEGLTVEV